MTSKTVYSIVLIDDHPLAINGIGAWLNSTGRFKISGVAGTLAEAEHLFKKIDPMPEIVILDISLGNEDGLKFIPKLKEMAISKIAAKKYVSASKVLCPKVLVCSMYEDPFLIQRAIDLGAAAYVSKSEDLNEIINAIDAILQGKTFVNPKYFVTMDKNPWEKLTAREHEIVTFVKKTFTNRQIAERLGISERTVGNHLIHIYQKLEISSRAELFEM
jgi:NarL family two-component system response regulator LiaR